MLNWLRTRGHFQRHSSKHRVVHRFHYVDDYSFAVVSSTTRPIGTGVGLFNHTAIDQMGGSTFHLIQKQQENDSGWIGCIVVACARRGVVRSLMVQDHGLLSCRVDSKWYVVFDQIRIFSSLTWQSARKIIFIRAKPRDEITIVRTKCNNSIGRCVGI